MPSTQVLALAFLIGVIAGLRTFTAPATVSWGLHLRWLTVGSSRLAFMGSTLAVIVFSLAAFGELVADKLPSAPNRTGPAGLIGRFVFGEFAGAILATAGGESVVFAPYLAGSAESQGRSRATRSVLAR